MIRILLLILLIASCAPPKEIEAEHTIVKAVDKKSAYRYGVGFGCWVTWYVESKGYPITTYEPCDCDSFLLGINFPALIRK